jgi:hypothetical protein
MVLIMTWNAAFTANLDFASINNEEKRGVGIVMESLNCDSLSTFGESVPAVVALGSKEQMVWSDAARSVAAVQDTHGWWDRAGEGHVRSAVR